MSSKANANSTGQAKEHPSRERFAPPRHIVWSTDHVDLADPFQRLWYIRQVLLHGRAEDIRTLDLEEVASSLETLDLPTDLHRLWKSFLEARAHARG